MSKFVLDCSVTISWILESQASEETDNLLDRVKVSGAIAPPIWLPEVSNVLVQAVKRERIAKTTALEQLALISKLPITIDQESQNRSFNEVFSLAIKEGLTSYDASYLDLSLVHGIPIATRDKALKRVAESLGIETLL